MQRFQASAPLRAGFGRPSPRARSGCSRRAFLRAGALAVAGSRLPAARATVGAQTPQGVLLPTWVADVNGDGLLDASDERLVRNALAARRGFGLAPAPGFDVRADVFGRGVVDALAVDSVRRTVQAAGGAPAVRRPVTIAWHYGWYDTLIRPPDLQTVRFKGGDYHSHDAAIETLFNDQKNELGITVDALSWIPERVTPRVLDNYRRGLLRAPNLATRHLALLYESTIALSLEGDRIDFLEPSVPRRLQEDFTQMGRFLAGVRDRTGGRIFTLDGRPVVYVFGSHTWGVLPIEGAQFTTLEVALDHAREAFNEQYGRRPFLVGDELRLAAAGEFEEDRTRRIRSFDAITVYHHAPLKELRAAHAPDQNLRLTPRYVEHQIEILRYNFRHAGTLRNRYTNLPLLVIPNLAAGFAKPGLPSILVGRAEYADFMKTLRDEYLRLLAEGDWPRTLGSDLLPAPVCVVGSWNEEFEGHAVFPAGFNQSLPGVVQHGFDLAMAIKETFGWNHYAAREIGS